MDGGLSIGLMVASQMMQAGGEASQLRAGARADEENARRAELQGALAAEDARRRGRAVQGEAIAALGASGVSLEGQSAQDLIFQNSLEIEYDILSKRYSAATEAQGLRASAAQKRGAARGALFGGMLRAGAAALTGFDEIGSAAAASKAQARLLEARFPGASRLPIPDAVRNAPWWTGSWEMPARTPPISGDPRNLPPGYRY